MGDKIAKIKAKLLELKAKHGPRFMAWWEGREYVPGPVVEPEAAPVAEPLLYTAPVAAPQTQDVPIWHGTRLDLLRELWGEGNAAPTEDEFFGQMYSQLALNASMSVLDIGDGVGGAAIHMAKEYKTYIDGYISNPDYAAAANRLVEQNGVQKHVRMFTYDIENFRPEKNYDVASVRRTLWRVPEVKGFLNIINDHLKPGGRMVVADYVAEASALNDPDMAAWYQGEHYRQTVSKDDLVATLEGVGYQVRVSDDITKQHVAEIKRGLAHLPVFLRTVSVPESLRDMILREADRWALRARLLEGQLRFYRFFAQKK